MLKNWCFQIVVLEKTLKSLLDSKEIKPVNPKRNQPWILIGRTDWCWSWSSNTLATWCEHQLIGKDRDAGKDWRQKERRAVKSEMVRQHHQLNGHESEQTPGDREGQRSPLCCSPWGRKESDTTWQLSNNNRQWKLIKKQKKISIQDMIPYWPSWPSSYSPICFSSVALSKGNKSEWCKIILNWFSQRQTYLQDFCFQALLLWWRVYDLLAASISKPRSGEVVESAECVLLLSEFLIHRFKWPPSLIFPFRGWICWSKHRYFINWIIWDLIFVFEIFQVFH